jgi:DNA polymerase epsilon subunit 1
VVPSVVTAWSLMNYMGSEIAQEYFRIVIGRFSQDVLRKQIELRIRDESKGLPSLFNKELDEQLLTYKKKMISKQFASTLTRAVGEIGKDAYNDGNEARKLLVQISPDRPSNPVLDFVKSVIAILELDQDVDTEVHMLKRSLLAQIGIAEYSSLAKWVNPCPTLILPDVFCFDCQESRDVNLCYIPPIDYDDEEGKRQIGWFCQDCGAEYNLANIERRLIEFAHKQVLRYQLQDLRCTKTNRVATHSLARVSECSAELKLDISPEEGRSEIETLHRLAIFHQMEALEMATQGILHSFQQQL